VSCGHSRFGPAKRNSQPICVRAAAGITGLPETRMPAYSTTKKHASDAQPDTR
jgi:hypothetical protein